MQMALASLMGQAFHLLSPLVAFIYLLLRLTGLDMGKWQRESRKICLRYFYYFCRHNYSFWTYAILYPTIKPIVPTRVTN